MLLVNFFQFCNIYGVFFCGGVFCSVQIIVVAAYYFNSFSHIVLVMSRRRKVDTLIRMDYDRNSHARRDLNDDSVRHLRELLTGAEDTIESLSNEVESLKAKCRSLEAVNRHLVQALESEYTLDDLPEPENTTYVDRTLSCKECGAEFIFSAGQQEDYDRRGLEHDPARCKECRDQMRDTFSHHVTNRVVEYEHHTVFEDRVLECRDCESQFIFSATQQESYQLRGLLHDPTRCKECRDASRDGNHRPPREGHMKDRVLDCRNCDSKFVFSADEQVVYERRGLLNDPTRCKDCREAIRSSRAATRNSGAPHRSGRPHTGGRNRDVAWGSSRQDITLGCRECDCKFIFTVAQQDTYQKKGLKNLPTRCKDCRLALRDNKSSYVENGILTENAPLFTSR